MMFLLYLLITMLFFSLSIILLYLGCKIINSMTGFIIKSMETFYYFMQNKSVVFHNYKGVSKYND